MMKILIGFAGFAVWQAFIITTLGITGDKTLWLTVSLTSDLLMLIMFFVGLFTGLWDD